MDIQEKLKEIFTKDNPSELEVEVKNISDEVSSIKEDISIIPTIQEELITIKEKVDVDIDSIIDKKVKDVIDTLKPQDGKDYVLTENDKKQIASKIKVPILNKIIEKTEVIKEQPIVTNEVKEVAVSDTGEEIVTKINELEITPELQIDAKHIKNLPEVKQFMGGGGSRLYNQLNDVDITGLTQDSVPKWNATRNIWTMGTASSGGGTWGSITGTLSNQTDLQSALDGLVPYTGATSDLDLGVYGLRQTNGSAFTNISNDGSALNLSGNSTDADGSIRFVNQITNLGAIFRTTNITTSDKTFYFPDDSGTLALTSDLATKQDTLVSGTNIKTINGSSILGSGDLTVGGSSYTFSTGLTDTAGTITNNLSTGIAGGQTVIGGTAASNALTLSSTSNATKGKIIMGTGFAYHENTNRLTVGTTTDMGYNLGVTGTLAATQSVLFATNSGNVSFGSTLNTGQVNFSVKQSTNTGLGWIFGYDSLSTNGFYIYTNETTASPNFNIYTGATQRLTIYGTTSMVLNEAGANFDIRMEGDTNANLFFLDASVDSIGIGHGAPDRLLHVEQADAVTNAVTYPFRVTHTSSGTVATNFGVGQEFEAENASNTNRVIGTHEFIYSDATNATEDATYKLRLIKAGTLTDAVTVDSIGNTTLAGVVKTAGYTVATLPTGVVGYRAYVTDALAPVWGANVVGGGAVTIPVFYDGANWIVA